MENKINFNNEKIGNYTFEKIKKKWKNSSELKGVNEGRCTIVRKGNKKVLRIKFPKGAIGLDEGGARWKLRFDKNYDEVYAQYKIMFPKGFNFRRGGKLPGLSGGSSPTGGKKCIGDGFSARIMWRVEGFVNNKIKNPYKAYLCQYVYYPGKDSSRKWGEDFNWSDLKREKVFIKPGKWHTIKTRIKLSIPGKRDDLIESWFDGIKVLRVKLDLRSKEHNGGIDSFNFVTFFGGNDSTWASPKTQYIYFDEFNILSKGAK